VSGKEWHGNDYKNDFVILNIIRNGKDIKDVEFAFMSANPDNGHLPITEYDDLIKIDNYRRANNHGPYAM
jgi:hypothetical protein